MNELINEAENWIEPGCSAAKLPKAVLMLLFGTPSPTERQSISADSVPCKEKRSDMVGPDATDEE